ncbi:MAG: hypothetical protein QOH71_1076 [Blastocatellia bacterium]|jgi:hypothetical protein|nr:hypothetical protein [Blastocatellia bacterium]
MLDLWKAGTVKLPNLDYLQGYKLTELQRDQVGCEGFELKRLLVKSCPLALFHFFLGAQITTRAAAQVEFPSGLVRLLAKAMGCYALLS